MKSSIVVNTDQFTVNSFGNGTAYSMTRKQDMLEFFVQGDDATTFWDQYTALLDNPACAENTHNEVLSEIFDEYESIAEPAKTALEALDVVG